MPIEHLSKINLNPYSVNIYIPHPWHFIFFKNKYNFLIYLYSNTYYFYLPLSLNFLNIFFDEASSTLSFFFFYKNNFYSIFWNLYKTLFSSFNKFFFKKLKFKGKGYYIYKNKRNSIALQFGYSHKKRLYFYFINVKFLSKTSILMFGVNKNNLIACGKLLYAVRPINIFTGKGIRFTRQITYRKTGKISSYR